MFDKMVKKALGFRDEDEIFGNENDAEGPGDPEIMGGMGGDMMKGGMHQMPGGPVMPGVDRATGRPYKQTPPTQLQSATDYPGQGGMRGYPVGSEAARMAPQGGRPSPSSAPNYTEMSPRPEDAGNAAIAGQFRMWQDVLRKNPTNPAALNYFQNYFK